MGFLRVVYGLHQNQVIPIYWFLMGKLWDFMGFYGMIMGFLWVLVPKPSFLGHNPTKRHISDRKTVYIANLGYQGIIYFEDFRG